MSSALGEDDKALQPGARVLVASASFCAISLTGNMLSDGLQTSSLPPDLLNLLAAALPPAAERCSRLRDKCGATSPARGQRKALGVLARVSRRSVADVS